MPRINNLICADIVAMSDSIIIQAVYIAIGPFFVVEGGGDGEAKNKKDNSSVISNALGNSAMRGLRLDTLSLIRSVSVVRLIRVLLPAYDFHNRYLQIMKISDHGSSKKFCPLYSSYLTPSRKQDNSGMQMRFILTDSSLTRAPSLRDGRSIRTVSALLLQLVQTSAHNVRIDSRSIAKARQQQFALRRQDSSMGDVQEEFLDDKDVEVGCRFYGCLIAD